VEFDFDKKIPCFAHVTVLPVFLFDALGSACSGFGLKKVNLCATAGENVGK
jgi:hypothetical protein